MCSCNADGIINERRRRVGLRLMSSGSDAMVGKVTFKRDTTTQCVGDHHDFSVTCAVRSGVFGGGRIRLRVRTVEPGSWRGGNESVSACSTGMLKMS